MTVRYHISVCVQIRNQRTEECYLSCGCTARSKITWYYVNGAISKEKKFTCGLALLSVHNHTEIAVFAS